MQKQFLTLALLAAASAAQAEDSFSLGVGFDYSTGKYGGDTSTNILYVPVTGKYIADKLTLKLTVPYIRVSSAGNVVSGMGRTGVTAASSKTTTQSGLGDVIATAAYVIHDSGKLVLDLAGNVKFGTASAQKSLGTGENDYSAQVDGFYAMSNTSLFTTLGYKVMGQPAGIIVNNIVYGSAGVSQKLDDKYTAGVVLDAAQSATELSPGIRELSVFVSNKIRPDLKLQANLMKGFSDASADYGVGATLTGTF